MTKIPVKTRIGGIGIMKLLILVPVIFLHCACKEEESGDNQELETLYGRSTALEKERHDLTQAINDSRQKISDGESNKLKLIQLKKQNIPILRYTDSLDESLGQYNDAIDVWREAHRKSLVGVEAKYLNRIDGSRINNVKILKVDDEDIDLLSDGKKMTVKIADLSEANRKRLIHESSLFPGPP